jgi:hypothetical protein
VLQQVRHLSPSFNAGLVGFVEAHRDNDEDKNRLCPPNPYSSSIEDWPGMLSRTWRTEGRWLSEPDVSAWVAQSPLNLLRALPDHIDEPCVQAAVKRYLTHVSAEIERLRQLNRSSSPPSWDRRAARPSKPDRSPVDSGNPNPPCERRFALRRGSGCCRPSRGSARGWRPRRRSPILVCDGGVGGARRQREPDRER